MAVCPLCHGYLHGKIDRDPAAFKLDWPDEMRFKLNEASGGWLWRKETREGWKKG